MRYLIAIVLSSLGCSSDTAPEYPEHDMVADLSVDVWAEEDADLGKLMDKGTDMVDPYAPPYPSPPGTSATQPGFLCRNQVQRGT